MVNKIDKSNLGFLGFEFQQELVKSMIEDQTFFKKINPIIQANMFTDERLRKIVDLMKDRYNSSNTVATYKDLDTLIRANISGGNSYQLTLAQLNNIKDNIDFRGIDLIRNTALKFCKQQRLIKAIHEGEKIIEEGDESQYEQLSDIMKDAVNITDDDNTGYKVFDNMEEVLSENFRHTIPTSSRIINALLNGGLAKGELGVIIASPGVGKTSTTTGFAAHASTYKCDANNNKGYKVLHIHFEDDEINIKRKYYAYITDCDANMLSRVGVRETIIKRLTIGGDCYDKRKLIDENIRCEHPLSGEKTATGIRELINKYISRGFYPDLVIVDYFECLKPEKSTTINDTKWDAEGITMRKLESIAHEYNIALWCPVQGTKDSIDAEFLSMSQAGGSVKKVQIGHVIMSIAKTSEQKESDTINITLNKFRGGKIWKSHLSNIKFNNGTCRFYEDDESSENTLNVINDREKEYEEKLIKDFEKTNKIKVAK